MSFYQLGAQIAAMIHIVQQLDSLAMLQAERNAKKKLQETTGDLMSREISILNILHSVLISPMGKEAIVGVLGVPPFFDILMPYLQAMKPQLYLYLQEDDPEIDLTKMTCFGYVIDLLSIVVKFRENVSFLETYADRICSMIPQTETTQQQTGTTANTPGSESGTGPAGTAVKFEEISKFIELRPWLSVDTDADIFGYDKLSHLVTIVQESLERLDKFPGELFTALRILAHVTVPKIGPDELNSTDNELIEELKYKYATIQLFSADLQTQIVNLLTKLFGLYQQPFLHGSNFCGIEGALVTMLLKPALALLKNILNQIIQVRNTEFKDLSAVMPLVQTFILLQAVPSTSQYYGSALELQQTVVSILLSYTQVVYTTEGEEVLVKSLWSQMMTEVIFQIVPL